MVVLVFCSQAKEQLEAERARFLADVERLQTKLEAAQEKYIESNVKVSQLADRVERADYSTQLTSQQLHNQSGNVEALARSKVKNTPFLNWYSRNFSTVIVIVLVFQAIDPIIKSTKNNKCSLIIRMQNGYNTHRYTHIPFHFEPQQKRIFDIRSPCKFCSQCKFTRSNIKNSFSPNATDGFTCSGESCTIYILYFCHWHLSSRFLDSVVS